MFARGETRNIFASRELQSPISRAPEHEPCLATQTKNPQAPGPFTLVQVFLLICLLLCLAVFTAPVRMKHSIWVQNKDLILKQARSPWPAETWAAGTCHGHDTTHSQGRRILTLLHVLLASTEHQRKNKSIWISAFKERKKSSCFGYFFFKLIFAVEGPNCFSALPHRDLNATTEVFW